MLTEKDYCDYETCIALKELGFREKCLTYYDTKDNVGLLYNTQWASYNTPYQFTDCLESHNAYKGNSYVDAPTLHEAQKWLREEKEFYVFVGREWENAYYYWLSKKVGDKTVGTTHSFYYPNGEGQFSSYEEALSEGIKEAVKILKDEQTK